jgi:hypothetical protein
MASKTIPPSPPNPHIVAMPAPVDTTLQPQYVTSPADEFKKVNYPYNLVNEFTVTCYSKDPAKVGDMAVLTDSNGKLLTKAPLSSGEPLTFANFTYFPLYARFVLEYPLTSPDVTVKLPLELFGPSGVIELKFKFGEFVEPDTVKSV